MSNQPVVQRTVLALALACAALAGCGSNPTYGDQVIAEGKGTKELGQKWNEGNDLVAKGTKLQEKGRAEIEDGKRHIAEGEDMVARGRSRMVETQQEIDKSK